MADPDATYGFNGDIIIAYYLHMLKCYSITLSSLQSAYHKGNPLIPVALLNLAYKRD